MPKRKLEDECAVGFGRPRSGSDSELLLSARKAADGGAERKCTAAGLPTKRFRPCDGTNVAVVKPDRRVNFGNVTLYYFERSQGFVCIPTRGGSTLGMADFHHDIESMSLPEHKKSLTEKRRRLLAEQDPATTTTSSLNCEESIAESNGHGGIDYQSTDDVLQDDVTAIEWMYNEGVEPSSILEDPGDAPSTSTENMLGVVLEDGEIIDDSASSDEDEAEYDEAYDVDVDEYFLMPIASKQRKRLLQVSGIDSIDHSESMECRQIRRSREVCGCECVGACDPLTCLCAREDIQCQVDRMSFPCGCTKNGCANPAGRVEFNAVRVRAHYWSTMMRLKAERDLEHRQLHDPSKSAPAHNPLLQLQHSIPSVSSFFVRSSTVTGDRELDLHRTSSSPDDVKAVLMGEQHTPLLMRLACDPYASATSVVQHQDSESIAGSGGGDPFSPFDPFSADTRDVFVAERSGDESHETARCSAVDGVRMTPVDSSAALHDSGFESDLDDSTLAMESTSVLKTCSDGDSCSTTSWNDLECPSNEADRCAIVSNGDVDRWPAAQGPAQSSRFGVVPPAVMSCGSTAVVASVMTSPGLYSSQSCLTVAKHLSPQHVTSSQAETLPA